MPDYMLDAAFWVTITFAALVIWLLVQGYWTRWAHRRVDEVERKMNARCNKIETRIEEVENNAPFPWMHKVK